MARVFKCPNSYYNSKTEKCVASKNKPKDVFKCSHTTVAAWLEYKPNPTYFIFCRKGEKIIYRCADAENEIFTLKYKDCVHECKKPGIFPDRRSSNQFYSCSGNEPVPQIHRCPMGYYFSETRCVREVSKFVPQISMFIYLSHYEE